METMEPMIHEYACAACEATFSFEAALHETEGTLRVSCPLCGAGDAGFVRACRPEDLGLTGIYKFSKALDRMVKVSNRASGRSRCGGSGCGSGCGSKCGSGCRGC